MILDLDLDPFFIESPHTIYLSPGLVVHVTMTLMAMSPVMPALRAMMAADARDALLDTKAILVSLAGGADVQMVS